MTLLEDLRRPTTIQAALIKIFCQMAAQFATADPGQNTIDFSGHRFILTALRIRTMHGKQRIYYCKCGRVALREPGSASVMALGHSACPVRLDACELNER
jgi:hypothetical protein